MVISYSEKDQGVEGGFAKDQAFLRPSLYESVPRGPHGYDSAFLADFVFYFAGCQTVKGLNVLLPLNWTQEKIHFWISSTKIFETAKQT